MDFLELLNFSKIGKIEKAIDPVASQLAAITNNYSSNDNLLNLAAVTYGKYLNVANGALIASASFSVSDFIPVTVGEPYTYLDKNTTFGTTINLSCWYRADYTFLSAISNTSKIINTAVAPVNAAFIRITVRNAYINDFFLRHGHYQDDFVVGPSFLLPRTRWYGKTASFLGDSITYGYELSYTQHRWSSRVARMLGATEDNVGVSGSLITRQTGWPSAMVDRYANCVSGAGLVVVMGGVNDYSVGTGVMGAETSTNPEEFYGALNTIIVGLLDRYPYGDIAFVTPFSVNHTSTGHNSDVANPVSSATLEDYCNAIIKRCGYYGVPCLDLFHGGGMDIAHNAQHKTLYTLDGLHPNNMGSQRIADKVFGFLKSI